MASALLSLADAPKKRRLESLSSKTTRDVGSVHRKELDTAFEGVIKQPRSDDRTWRSASRDGLGGAGCAPLRT
jgi:hypothetical protein